MPRSDPLAALGQSALAELNRVMAGAPLFDAHTHVGFNDPDGLYQSEEDLYAVLDGAGGARAVTFPMHEPGGYPEANDAVIDIAARSHGRISALCRLDPRAEPTREARRCLDAGAAGIKLHPRAERFTLSDPGVESIFALAHEAGVPVLVHAGRGIPALGRDAVGYCRSYPDARVILAHAGICDLAWIWRVARELPNLLFDTAWWNPSDMLSLFALVPPGNLLFASDAPYGQTLPAATMDLRVALQVGHDTRVLREHFAGRLEAVLAGGDLEDLGPAPGLKRLRRDPLLERVQTWTALAAMMTLRSAEMAAEPLAIARLACAVGEEAPQAGVCREVLALLEVAQAEIEAADGEAAAVEVPPVRRPGVTPLMAATIVAATPDVALPAPQPDGPAPRR